MVWKYLLTSNSFVYLFIRYSLLPALSQDGIIYSNIKLGSYDGNSFLGYLKGLLEVMNPYPAPRSVLVLDNCHIHHVTGVRELCDQWCIQQYYRYYILPELKWIFKEELR